MRLAMAIAEIALGRRRLAERGGAKIGDARPRRKLTDDDVDRMLELRALGWTYGRIAAELDVHTSTVNRIVRARLET